MHSRRLAVILLAAILIIFQFYRICSADPVLEKMQNNTVHVLALNEIFGSVSGEFLKTSAKVAPLESNPPNDMSARFKQLFFKGVIFLVISVLVIAGTWCCIRSLMTKD